jgi:hypothetical protein
MGPRKWEDTWILPDWLSRAQCCCCLCLAIEKSSPRFYSHPCVFSASASELDRRRSARSSSSTDWLTHGSKIKLRCVDTHADARRCTVETAQRFCQDPVISRYAKMLVRLCVRTKHAVWLTQAGLSHWWRPFLTYTCVLYSRTYLPTTTVHVRSR